MNKNNNHAAAAPLVDVWGLRKTYEKRVRTGGFFNRKRSEPIEAVSDVSFIINPRERVAFIGPNGAGKSTTLKILTGILHPTSGHAKVAGFVPWKDRKQVAMRIGTVFGQRSQLWADLDVVDSFDLIARIYGVEERHYHKRCEQLCDLLKIGGFLKSKVRTLSLGQRMRCEIAASLLHQPQVLFLDEPTIGLDVEAKAILRSYLRRLAEEEDTAIILTSHDGGDIDRICDRIILIDDGRLFLDEPLAQFRARHEQNDAPLDDIIHALYAQGKQTAPPEPERRVA